MNANDNTAADASRRKIIDRIGKLLALSRDAGATEAEALNAAEKVQTLLIEHNLSLSDLGQVSATIRDTDFLTSRSAWIRPLLMELGKLYFCGHFVETFPADFIKRHGLDKGNHKLLGGSHQREFLRHNFIGTEANVTIVKAMGEYIIDTMHAVCKQEQKKYPANERVSFQHSFLNACSVRLCSRMRKMRETGTESVKSNLPAVLSMYAQAQASYSDWLAASDLKVKTRRVPMNVHHEGGARDGYKAGGNIGLNQQVGGSKVMGAIAG